MDKFREEFEKKFPDYRFEWNADRSEYWPSKNWNGSDGVLTSCIRRDRELMIWKASRESLVIELPVIYNKDWSCNASECEAMRNGITITKHAINSAGVRTK